ncbi:MAG: DNA polymerase Y family protein [Aestuariivita sp.]|nr:DNA polymerase Y family protein [Aestuariivita sp.]
MVRILSIWLPRLPLDRLIRKGDPRTNGSFAITAERKNAARLTHLTATARQAGLAPGLSIPDARAICPDLLTEPANPTWEAALLKALARWADQLSPRVALDAPEGLLLDISGCTHLFGGEAAMGAHARQRLGDIQIEGRIGIADTKGAARALARFSQQPVTIAPAGRTSETMKALPIAALNLSDKMVAELRQTGLKTIGQLYAVKASELARRFGLELTTALNRLRGHAPDPIMPAPKKPSFAARMSLPEPVGYLADIKNVLGRLAASVCQRLIQEQKGARRFELTVCCVNSGDHLLSIGFARPCFEPGPIQQQFARALNDLKLDYGADWFRLAAHYVEPIRLRQMRLHTEAEAEDHIAHTISTLGNRVGFDHVRRFQSYDSHLPDREFFQIEAVAKTAQTSWQPRPRKRPLRLFQIPERVRTLEPDRPPKQFEWRYHTYRTAKAQGPERLTPEWWRDSDNRIRDYWRVQTEDGPRLWLLNFPGVKSPDWFVAGRFP